MAATLLSPTMPPTMASSPPSQAISTSTTSSPTSSQPTKTSTTTTTSKALLIPEILNLVLTHLNPSPSDSSPCYTSQRTLQSAACVNTLWNSESLRLLWRLPPNTRGYAIPELLSQISPARRRECARWLEEGMLDTLDKEVVLQGLMFPRLRSVLVMVWEGREELPVFDGQGVKEVIVQVCEDDGEIECDGWFGGGMRFEKGLTRRIVQNFPNLETLKFANSISMEKEVLKEMVSSLPRLTTIDKEKVYLLDWEEEIE